MESGGQSRVTTALAPIAEPAPMTTGPSTFAPAPTVTLSSNVGWRLTFARLRPPSVTPWYSITPSPISAVSPMTTPMPWSMKNRRPMVAPGWISMPVRKRVNCDRMRARPFAAPPFTHSAWAARCAQMACRPE